MSVPEDLRYTKEHEWLRIVDDTVTVGVTHFAQDQLGDVVFVELPEVGTEVTANAAFGSVESVKAVSDLFAPVSGEIVAVNEKLSEAPEIVNQDPYGDGWMIQIKMSAKGELDGLLSAAQYQEHLAS